MTIPKELLKSVGMILALACVALVGIIEILNHQAGDAIARKKSQEPHSKWRMTSPGFYRMTADREFRRMRYIPIEQPLSLAEKDEIDRMGEEAWITAQPHQRIAYAMSRLSPLGILLGAALFFAGLSVRMGGGVVLRFLYIGIGIATLVITLVRYVPILGW